MKFFIVALMSMIHLDTNSPNVYIFYEPTFETFEECRSYAQANGPMLMQHLFNEFGPKDRPQMVSCVNEEVIKKILNPEYKEESKTNADASGYNGIHGHS